jgi:hypothetical protein
VGYVDPFGNRMRVKRTEKKIVSEVLFGVVSFAHLEDDPSIVVREALRISPEYRGQGLMQFLEDLVDERITGEVWNSVVAEQNQLVRRQLEKTGWTASVMMKYMMIFIPSLDSLDLSYISLRFHHHRDSVAFRTDASEAKRLLCDGKYAMGPSIDCKIDGMTSSSSSSKGRIPLLLYDWVPFTNTSTGIDALLRESNQASFLYHLDATSDVITSLSYSSSSNEAPGRVGSPLQPPIESRYEEMEIFVSATIFAANEHEFEAHLFHIVHQYLTGVDKSKIFMVFLCFQSCYLAKARSILSQIYKKSHTDADLDRCFNGMVVYQCRQSDRLKRQNQQYLSQTSSSL